MNRQLDDLLLQRGRLIERIASQRAALRNDFVPVSAVLDKADAAVSGVRSCVDYVRRHPVLVSAVAGTLLIFKGKTMLRWGGKAFSLWQSWRLVQDTLLGMGGRARL